MVANQITDNRIHGVLGRGDTSEISTYIEKAIDNALAQGKWEMRIIHGNGKGKLKSEVHKLLSKHPCVKSFENKYSPSYGWGSTVVYFK